jgi:acyl transferase domain-containing protein
VAWVVSARSADALTGQAARLLAHMGADPDLGVADVGWSLVTTRSVFEHRAVVVGADREALTAGLAGLAAGAPGTNVVVGRARPVGKTVFVFPGHGSQWLGMGQQLYQRFPVFAKAFDEAAAALDGHLRVPLKRVIWGDDADLLQNTEFAQPASFAIEIALAALLQHWGVAPDVVTGDRVGEIAAAYVAGVLSLTDAAKVVAARGRLIAELPAGGVLTEPMIAEFGRAVAGVSAAEPRITLVSNVTGRLAEPGYGSADYWMAQVRAPARFVDGAQMAESLQAGVFVEMGPGGSLMTIAKDRSEVDSLLIAAGRLFATGIGVEWAAVFDGLGAQRVELPTYAFQRHRFWLGTRSADFAERLKGLAPNEQHRQLVELVCAHAAAVLGHSGSRDINPDRSFQHLGFELPNGLELRNRLKTETGLALSRTVIFDYPTPTALADHLQRLIRGDDDEPHDEKIWSTLQRIPLRELRRTGLLDKLLLLAGEPEQAVPDPAVSDDMIDSLSPDALVAMALDPDDVDGVQ